MELELEKKVQKPVNDIYWVPIKAVSFMECFEGPPLVGHRETRTLCEGRDAEFARANLSEYPGCGDNWNKLTLEQKRRISPFWIDNDRKVEKVLYCERRFKNGREDYTCGKPVNENGEYDFGDGFDPY